MSEEKKYDEIALLSGTFKTTLNKMYKNRKPWVAADPKELRSAMPGMVVEMRVKVGDAVQKGDCVMLFKAMKMNNNILAPISGTIKSVNVNMNENMPKNTLMIEFE